MTSSSLAWRGILSAIVDDRIPAFKLSQLLGKAHDNIQHHLEKNMLSVSCGQSLVSLDGSYLLTETQALSICHHLEPRNYVVASSIQVAFLVNRFLIAQRDPQKLSAIAQDLGDLATTPVGISVLRFAAKELTAT